MAKRFEDILDECIALVTQGESIEQCLERYPEEAKELESLLRVALATTKASSIEPSPDFRARARYQLRSTLQAAEQGRQRRRLPVFGWQRSWAIAIATVLIFLLAGGGTVAASINSMPDESLYQVKLATEEVQLRITPSALGKAKLHANFADRRVDEIARMVNEGKHAEVEGLANHLTRHMENVELQAEAQLEREPGSKSESKAFTELRELLQKNAVRHQQVLHELEETAPDSAKRAISHAIEASTTGYKRALQSVGAEAEKLKWRSKPELLFDYSSGKCATRKESVASISVSGNKVLFSGLVITPTPCYDLKAELSSRPPAIIIEIKALKRAGFCTECIGEIPFEGEAIDLDPGEYEVSISYQGKNIGQQKIEIP